MSDRDASQWGCCTGCNRALDPRQGALAASLVRVLAPLYLSLVLVDAEQVDGVGH